MIMFCKFCGKQIPDDAAVCPQCGKSLAQEEKGKALKICLMVLGVAALCVVLAWVIYFGVTGKVVPDFLAGNNSGIHNPSGKNDIYNKQTYYGTDDKAIAHAGDVVATAGNSKLTNAMLQIIYWYKFDEFCSQYGSYLPYFGLDYTKPLNTQIYDSDKGLTWQQYFLETALNTWNQYASLNEAAEKEGFKLSEDAENYLKNLEKTMEDQAKEDKYDSVDAMLQKELGAGVTLEVYREYLRLYYTVNMFFAEKGEAMDATMAEIEAYFKEHEDDLKENKITKDSGPMYDVRHILVMPTGGTKSEDGKTTVYSDAEWEACRVKAQALLDEWLKGDATEESFATMATLKSEDPGSKSQGGLYEMVPKGQMVEPFESWCLEEGRQKGDYGLVKTSYGYHIMYFVESDEAWIRYCRSSVVGDKASKFLSDLMKNCEMTVQYSKILLADVSFSK